MEIHIKFTLSILIFRHLSINQNQRLIHDIWKTRKIILPFFITYADYLIPASSTFFFSVLHAILHTFVHLFSCIYIMLARLHMCSYMDFLLISSAYFTSSVAVIAVMKLVHFMIPRSIFFCCTWML